MFVQPSGLLSGFYSSLSELNIHHYLSRLRKDTKRQILFKDKTINILQQDNYITSPICSVTVGSTVLSHLQILKNFDNIRGQNLNQAWQRKNETCEVTCLRGVLRAWWLIFIFNSNFNWYLYLACSLENVQRSSGLLNTSLAYRLICALRGNFIAQGWLR